MQRYLTLAAATLGVLLTLMSSPAWAFTTGNARADRLAAAFRVPLPAGPVIVSRSACPDGGDDPCASIETPCRVYLNHDRDPIVLAHEIGHCYLEPLGGYWHGALVDVTGARSWEDGGADLAAEAYATCALGMRPPRAVGHGRRRRMVGSWETSPYGYAPSRREQRHACSLIRRSALQPERN